MERSIIGLARKHRVRNQEIREKTGTRDVLQSVRLQKMRYAGHKTRKKGEVWAKRITEWISYRYKSSKGRPTMRWRQEIVQKVGTL